MCSTELSMKQVLILRPGRAETCVFDREILKAILLIILFFMPGVYKNQR